MTVWEATVEVLAARRARREEIERSRARMRKQDRGAKQERDERKMQYAQILAEAARVLRRPGFHGSHSSAEVD